MANDLNTADQTPADFAAWLLGAYKDQPINESTMVRAFAEYADECQDATPAAPPDRDAMGRLVGAASGGEAVPKWIDDPHDIEQGQMLNPAWLKLHGVTAAEAVASGTKAATPSAAFNVVYEEHCGRPITNRTIAWRCFQAGAAIAAREQEPSREVPTAPDVCPITSRKFWGNMDHPERGMVALYGGPYDSYSIPELCEDGELRSEHYDQDAGEWEEGGVPAGWFYADQPELASRDEAPAPQQSASILIDFKQATDLLAMFGGEPNEITLSIGGGHSGSGVYASYTDLPEEGAIFLGVSDQEAMPDEVPLAETGEAAFEQKRARTLLAHLWRRYDAAGTSMGRSHESVVLEAALSLLGDPDPEDMALLDKDSGDLVNATRSYLSSKLAERFFGSAALTAAQPADGKGEKL